MPIIEDDLTYQEIYNEMQISLSAKNMIEKFETEWNSSHGVDK